MLTSWQISKLKLDALNNPDYGLLCAVYKCDVKPYCEKELRLGKAIYLRNLAADIIKEAEEIEKEANK